MKKTARLTALILIVMTAAMLLAGMTGCSKEEPAEAGSPYLGTWIATKAAYEGIEYDAEDTIGGTLLFILNEDGTAHLQVKDEKELVKWKTVDSGIVIIEGDNEMKMTASGSDLLVWNYDGADFYMERAAGE